MPNIPVNVPPQSATPAVVPVKHIFVSIPPSVTVQDLSDNVRSSLQGLVGQLNTQLKNIEVRLTATPSPTTIGQQIQNAIQPFIQNTTNVTQNTTNTTPFAGATFTGSEWVQSDQTGVRTFSHWYNNINFSSFPIFVNVGITLNTNGNGARAFVGASNTSTFITVDQTPVGTQYSGFNQTLKFEVPPGAFYEVIPVGTAATPTLNFWVETYFI